MNSVGHPAPPETSALATPVPGEEVEREIARHMVRRLVVLAPLVVVGCGLWRGADAAAAAAIALAVVGGSFLAGAASITWAARISIGALTAAAFVGYGLRLGAITVVGLVLRDQPWIDFPVFCGVLLVSYLGLLVWELRSISLSFAAPGLRPARK